MQLHRLLLAIVPFALVALFQFHRSMSLDTFAAKAADRRPSRKPTKAKTGPAPFDGSFDEAAKKVSAQLRVAAGDGGAAIPAAAATPTAAATLTAAAASTTAGSASAATTTVAPRVDRLGAQVPRFLPVDGDYDHARDYPAPTISPKRLLDRTRNWLPVPSAEDAQPADLAWRKQVAPNATRCPPGRRPFHTLLTAQKSLYQEWQTKIFYLQFRKAQAAGGPCTEMTGFTRLLAGNQPDELMALMPTIRIEEASPGATRGFQVINRPWTLQQLVGLADWRSKIPENYVYIAETDHLLLRDIPNRATPELNVAFFFPYMSPVPGPQAAVVKRYYDGDHLAVQPVGGSPAIMHVDTLKRLAPVWYDLSVKLKADREADRAFGWVLEMWGYSIACARLGIKQFVWQQLQIEPAAAWHQDVSAQDPYIYHYTFGVEYSFEGVPKVGGVGEWSLDKRKYYGRAPPAKLTAPPECAQECASRWHGIFTEAIGALSAAGQWYASTGSDTVRSQRPPPRTPTPLARAIVRVGPWKLADGAEVFFFRRGVAYSRFGGGAWTERDATTVQLTLCSPVSLAFDDPTRPTSFTYNGKQATLAMDAASPARAAEWAHAGSAAVQRLLGEGPWMFRDQQPLAFLWGGVVAGPRGFDGSYAPIDGADDAVALTIGGASYRLKMTGCYTFVATEKGSGATHKGWIPMRHVSMEYTGWRDAGGCTL